MAKTLGNKEASTERNQIWLPRRRKRVRQLWSQRQMTRGEGNAGDNQTHHSYFLESQIFIHVPHTQRHSMVTAEVCEFSQMEGLCNDSQVNEEDLAGMLQHHSGYLSPLLFPVNCYLNTMNPLCQLCYWIFMRQHSTGSSVWFFIVQPIIPKISSCVMYLSLLVMAV